MSVFILNIPDSDPYIRTKRSSIYDHVVENDIDTSNCILEEWEMGKLIRKEKDPFTLQKITFDSLSHAL